jgi:hypothetical protein
MQLRTKRERYLVIFCVVFLILVAVFVMTPPSKPAGTAVQLSATAAEAQWRSQAVKYRQLVDSEQMLTPKLRRLTYREAPETVAALLTQDLQLIAARSGIHLNSYKPSRPAKLPAGDIVRVPVEIRFRARFQPDVIRFLYAIEDPAGRRVVDRIDINPAEAKLKQVEVSARISVFTQSVAGTTGTGEGETGDDSEGPGRG